MPMTPSMMTEADPMPKKGVTAISIKMGKMGPMSFKLPKGWASDSDDEVKEALLKFKDNGDGTGTFVSLDGAPFAGGKMGGEEEQPEMPENPDEEVPADMPMEDAITALQKRDRSM